MAALMRVARDIYRCLSTLDSFTNGQARVVEWDWDNFSELVIELMPRDGLYGGGTFRFKINLEDYPYCGPEVECLTTILHPNINPESGEVCFNLLSDWDEHSENIGLDNIINGLLFLLYMPNMDDPLWTPDGGWKPSEFSDSVKATLAGGTWQSYNFEPNQTVGNSEHTSPNVPDCAGPGVIPQLPLVSKVTDGIIAGLEHELRSKTNQVLPPSLCRSKTVAFASHMCYNYETKPDRVEDMEISSSDVPETKTTTTDTDIRFPVPTARTDQNNVHASLKRWQSCWC